MKNPTSTKTVPNGNHIADYLIRPGHDLFSANSEEVKTYGNPNPEQVALLNFPAGKIVTEKKHGIFHFYAPS